MKFNLNYNVIENPIVRAICFIMSMLFLIIGILTLKSKLGESPLTFDHTFKFGIAATGWGAIMFFWAVRKFFLKKKPRTIGDHKKNGKNGGQTPIK